MTIQPSNIITPTSMTLIRRDALPTFPVGLQGRERIRRFIRAVSLVSSTLPDRDKFRPDVVTSQKHTFTYEFTNHSVPRGEEITDHSRRKPKMVVFSGMVTETPFFPYTSGGIGGLPFLSRVNDYVQQLIQFAEEREPVFLTSSVLIHPSMGIKSLTIAKDTQTGQAVNIQIALKEVRRVAEIRARPIPDDIAAQLGASPPSVGAGTTGGSTSG